MKKLFIALLLSTCLINCVGFVEPVPYEYHRDVIVHGEVHRFYYHGHSYHGRSRR